MRTLGRTGIALAVFLCGSAAHASLERNWSRTGVATQSSTDLNLGGEARRAIDGNTDGNWLAKSVTHTLEEDQPYWQIDLGASYHVDQIRIYGRSDCCQERLKNFVVFSLDTDDGFKFRDLSSTLSQAHVNSIPVFLPEGIRDRATGVTVPGHVIEFGGERARFIRIQLAGHDVLSLAEVEVIGRYDIAGPLPFADAVTWQKTPITIGAAATLTSNTANLILLFTGADRALHASVDFQSDVPVAGSPDLTDATPGAAWDATTNHLFVSGIEARRGKSRKIWILETEVSRSGFANSVWQTIGTGSSPPAVAVACGKVAALWRNGQAVFSSWRPDAPGSSWTPAQQVGTAQSDPSLTVNAKGDFGMAYFPARRGIAFQTAPCSNAALTWSPPTLLRGAFSGDRVSVAAYGNLFAAAALGTNNHALYATELPSAGTPWSSFEAVDFTGPPLAESPTLFVFEGITLALSRAVDGTMRYWVRTPNTIAARDGWIGGKQIPYGGTGALPPMVTEIGLSRISGINGAPSDLFIASRNSDDHAISALNVGRFIARDVITNVFDLRIGADDTEFARAQWGDIPDISNLYEHMVALLALPRAAWPGIASKQCGTLSEPTRIVIPPAKGGTAHPDMCPMRVWLDGTSGGPVASATGGLMHEWMHMDLAQRNVATNGFSSAFKFNPASTDPAESGLRACESAAWCGGDPCEKAGDDHGTREDNTRNFADSDTAARRWDDVRVCVSSHNGPAGRRYQGGFAWYDLTSSDHVFIHTAVWYRWFGDELRDMAFADKIHGNSQLQERYDWIKQNYFGGVEYNGRLSGTLPQTDRSLGYFGMPNQ